MTVPAAGEISFPLRVPPVANDETRPFWIYAAAGELRYQQCTHCEKSWMPPAEACPFCWTGSPRWVPACGRATLQSWVTYHRQWLEDFPVPYVVALAQLDEGPRYTALVTSSGDKVLRRGLELRVLFAETDCELDGIGVLRLPVFEVV